VTSAVPIGVRGARARLVPDAAYHRELLALVATARRSCLCNVFLVDVSPARDATLLVDGVLEQLASTHWLGTDTRLLIGGSRENPELAEAADLSRARAKQLGIPCRWLTSRPVRGSHSKYVIADDCVLTGSHNWSVGAFTDQTQDSILVESRDLAALLRASFERGWARAAE
jgi:phosphatidylserine/phosphatidylglycerophosphate/cardiolipin synthase-like enzyme